MPNHRLQTAEDVLADVDELERLYRSLWQATNILQQSAQLKARGNLQSPYAEVSKRLAMTGLEVARLSSAIEEHIQSAKMTLRAYIDALPKL